MNCENPRMKRGRIERKTICSNAESLRSKDIKSYQNTVVVLGKAFKFHQEINSRPMSSRKPFHKDIEGDKQRATGKGNIDP